MIINTNYTNLQVGQTTRVYLEIPDLKDNSGNKIHLSEIKKVVIEKLNNDHLEPNKSNIIIDSFYGLKNPRITVSNNVNFLNYFDQDGNSIKLNNYYIKINNPSALSGYYKIIDVPLEYIDENNTRQSKQLIIEGIFSEISENIVDFSIVNSNYENVDSTLYEECQLHFNAQKDEFSPVWKKYLFYFQDYNLYNFSTIGYNYGTSSYDYKIENCFIEISYDGSSYEEYPCGKLFVINKDGYEINNSFFIEAFNDSLYNYGEVISWRLLDPDKNEIILSGPHIQNNGIIKRFYESIVKFETFVNSNNENIYRYYFDWVIKENAKGSEGSYLIYWYVKRTENSLTEIFQNTYLVHSDYSLPSQYKRKFQRENYHELLQKYLPFFYQDYGANDVIVETLKAFGEGIFDLQDKADKFLNVMDPKRAPANCLPYLANLFSFSLKGNDIINWRQQITNIPKILKKKGTLEGLSEILKLIGAEIKTAVFYWQVKSNYVWTDYFFLNNGSESETLELKYNPILQYTQDYYQIYNLNEYDDKSQYGLCYKRCSIEYYSQDKSKWYKLFPAYEGNILMYDFLNIVRFSLINDNEKIQQYSKNILWNFNSQPQDLYYVEHFDLIGNFTSDLYNEIKSNKLAEYKINIKNGDVRLGTYSFSPLDIEWSLTSSEPKVMIEIKYYDELNSLFYDQSSTKAEISFDLLKNNSILLNNIKGTLNSIKQTVKSVKDHNGNIRGYDESTGLIETFTPDKNDIIKISYQYKDYPYELNSSSSDYQMNFDNYEICKDDYILSLDCLDNRNPYDENYPDNKLIPLVNYNIKLLPDSECYINNTEYNDLECLNEYNICDICSQTNPFHDPLVYGHIRTKFPWSENVYNMDEYDGSTRPSFEPCDIDEDFIDTCKCCWSSFLSLSIEISNLTDDLMQTVRKTIDEFKPFHSRIKDISFIGKYSDNVHVYDDQHYLEIRSRQVDNLNLGYYPFNYLSGSHMRQKRSNTYFFAHGKFKTHEQDLLDNVYLTSDSLSFEDYGIGNKTQLEADSILPILNINTSRIVFTGPSTQNPHYNKSYNIEKIEGHKLKLADASSDDGDSFPSISSWSYSGPWSFDIYNRKYPSGVLEKRSSSANNDTVSIFKTADFEISSSVDFFTNGLGLISDIINSNIYQVYIESGAQTGFYSVSQIKKNSIIISDYNYGDPYGSNIAFTVYKNGEQLENNIGLSGYLDRIEVYGEFNVSGTWDDFALDWDIKKISCYVYVKSINSYYPIHDISGNHIKISQYSFGPDGSQDISIFYKVLEGTDGFISATTDIIYSENDSVEYTVDFYNLINSFGINKIDDFLIGIYLNGQFNYYPIKEIYDDSIDVNDIHKIKLDSANIDQEISTAQDFYIRIYQMSNYKINDTIYPETIYPNSTLLKNILEGTATGGSSSSLIDSNVNFEELYVQENDIIILRNSQDLELKSLDVSGSITLNSNIFETTETWIENEHINKILYIKTGSDIGQYTIISNTTADLYVDRNFSSNDVSVDAVINIPVDWTPEYPQDIYGWAIVGSVVSNTINFKSIYSISGTSDELQQSGLNSGSFGNGILYRIIRRNIFDYNMDIPKTDIVRIKLDSIAPELLIPLENIIEINAPIPIEDGEYSLLLNGSDQNNFVQISSSSHSIQEDILVGPLDNIHPSYLPESYDTRYRIINKDIDPITGQIASQFRFSISGNLKIDENSVTVIVNGISWTKVNRWTDPSSGPGLYGLKEYLTFKKSDHEVEIVFGDGFTGKKIDPSDIINVIYNRYGYLPGPQAIDSIEQNESAIFEIENIDISSPNYGQKITVRAK